MKLLSCLIENCIVQRMFCLSLQVSNFLSLCPFSELKYIIIGEHGSCCAGYPEGSNWFCFLLILKNLQDRQRNLKDSIGPLESFRKQIICFEIKKKKKLRRAYQQFPIIALLRDHTEQYFKVLLSHSLGAALHFCFCPMKVFSWWSNGSPMKPLISPMQED